MQVLGIRYCSVSTEAESFAKFLDALGMSRRYFQEFASTGPTFDGAIFPAGASWIELWPAGSGMAPGTMLQVIVDDADAFAAHARAHGLDPQGPMDAHGERIYFVTAPDGLQMSFQSAAGEPPK